MLTIPSRKTYELSLPYSTMTLCTEGMRALERLAYVSLLLVSQRHGDVAQLLANLVQRCHAEVADGQQFVG